jgi:L-iditol 2-dehydrogenase
LGDETAADRARFQKTMTRAALDRKIPRRMRAVVYRGPNDLRLETLPVPAIRPGELLVRVALCGVCPTDIKKIQFGTVPPPRVFGHETAGTIVRIGGGKSSLATNHASFHLGDRVALHHHVPCLDCHFCRHRAFAQCAAYKRTGVTAGFEPAGGGYAEFVRVLPFVLPGVVKIPARNSFAEGALLEPVNTVLKAVCRLNLLPGDVVLVAGQGPIGLMFTRLLELAGARVLATDLLAPRLKLARRFGARWTALVGGTRRSVRADFSDGRARQSVRADLWFADGGARGLPRPASPVSLIHRLTRGRGLDAAVIAVPSDVVVRQAATWLRGGGQLLVFAHTRRGAPTELDLASVCVDEKDLIGSYSSDLTLQAEVARLVFSRRLDVRPLITHQFPLEETPAAIALAARPSPDALKIMVSQTG